MAVMNTIMPTILFTRPKTQDLGRFEDSIAKFNKTFKDCAEAVGCPAPPTLKPFRADPRCRDVVSVFEEALHHWKDGGMEIPVCLALQTPAGLNIAAKILSRIERVFGYVDCDGTGCDENDGARVRALLLFDEGGLVEKGTDTTEWAAVLKNKFGSCRKSKSFSSKTLLDVASSLAFVTATPQALMTTALRLDERAFIYCDLPVSKNYCGYVEGLDQPVGFKAIRRRTLPEKDETGRGVRQQFYDYVATTDKPIAGMVYTNEAKASKIKSRIEEARETAVNYGCRCCSLDGRTSSLRHGGGCCSLDRRASSFRRGGGC